MRAAFALALLLAVTASAQDLPAEAFAESRTAFAAGQAEAAAGRWAEAVPHFEVAVVLRPGQTGYRLSLARAYAEADRPEAARATLLLLAAMGVTVRPEVLDPMLTRLADPEAVRAAFAVNRRPVGRADTAATWADRSFGPEGVAADGGRLFVSSMRRGEIVVLERGGVATLAMLAGATLRGLAADPPRRRLWAGVALADGATGGLLAVDLDTGDALTPVLPVDPVASPVGDLAVGPDGAVYASTAAGAVVRLGGLGEAADVLIPSGVLPSPQGLVLTEDGRALVVADYATGLHRVDIAARIVTPLDASETTSLLGIDGLVGRGDTLYAVQNGLSPYRVLRLRLDGGRVEADVLLANDGRLGEPTNAALTEAGLLVVANAVWPLLDADGGLDPEAARPPLVLLVPLD